MSKSDNRRRAQEPILSSLLSEGGKRLGDVVWGAIDAGKDLAEAHNDKAERRLIYQRIGEFISKLFQFPEELGFRVGVHLTGRGDAAVADVPPPPPGLVATVSKSLLLIRLQYLVDDREYSRVVSFWYRHGDKVGRQTVSEQITWDALPREVREQWQRDRESPVTFRLYSEEN